MNAYAAGVDLYFQDPHLGRAALYRAGGTGYPIEIRVVESRPDAEVTFGAVRASVATAVFDIRLSEIADPRPGDTIHLGSDVYVVQGAPKRDDDRMVWRLDTHPA